MLLVFSRLLASRLSPFGLALAIVALASSSSPALILPILNQGGTYVWMSGSSGNGNWNTSTNWTVTGGTNPGPIPGASATVDILDGNQPSETITYNYTGIAVTLSGLFIGDGTNTGSPGTGVNTLSIGSGFTLSSSVEDVGDGAGFSYGQGAILQTGGTNNGGTGLGLTLNLGFNATDTGQYTLQSGALNAITENIGDYGTGIFTQTGGTNTASGLTLSAQSSSNGTYNLNAGTLTVSTTISLNGNGTTGGTFNLNSAATLSYNTFNQSGGAFNGTLTNSSIYNYSAGNLTGELINHGTANLTGGTFSPTAGIDNFGTLNISYTASIGGNGAVTNEASGIINGSGTISSTAVLANAGILSANVSGQTLEISGPPSITNTGTLRAIGGATLNIDPTTINNLGGTITAANGSVAQLDATTVLGGTISSSGTGYIQVVYDTVNGGSTIDGSNSQEGPVTISTGSTISLQGGATLSVVGPITNNGNISIAVPFGVAPTTLQVGDGSGNPGSTSATLSGTGSVTMFNSTISGYATTGDTLTNGPSHTIQGAGTIQNLNVTNNGVINANTGTLTLQSLGSVTNTVTTNPGGGTMEATNGGQLNLNNLTINNSGGTISSSGGGILTLTSTTISGGNMSTLDSSSTIQGQGTIQNLNLINNGMITGNDSGAGTLTLTSLSSLTNNASGKIEPGISTGSLLLNLTASNVTNSGLIEVGGSSSAYTSTISTSSINNSGMIEATGIGGGTLIQNPTSLTNSGTIQATGDGTLTIQNSTANPLSITNNGGTIQTTGSTEIVKGMGSVLILTNLTINNHNGFISATGGILGNPGDVYPSIASINSSIVLGGTVSTDSSPGNSSAVELQGTNPELNGYASQGSVTLSGNILPDSASGVLIAGTIINNGSITDQNIISPNVKDYSLPAMNLKIGDGTGATGSTTADLQTTGTGTLTMAQSGSMISGYASTNTLTNDTGHTLQGQGTIQNLKLINNGTIDADIAGATLSITTNITDNSTGILEATDGGEMNLTNLTITGTGTILTGTGSKVVITNSNVTVSNLTVHGNETIDPSTLEAGDVDLESDGSLALSAGDQLIIDNELTDNSLPGNFVTAGADLEFAGSGVHDLSTDNLLDFQMLALDPGASLDATGKGSLFADEIILPDETPADIGTELQGDLAITYDVNNPANAYLLDATYTLPSGGSLSPVNVPEPTCAGMIAMAGWGLLGRRRRRS
jgi:hypothetical protein